MKRRRLPLLQRVKLFDAHGGRCHVCELRIQVGQEWHVDHIVPLADGGADDESNMAPAHKKRCHPAKTAQEATDRAKVVRIRARFLGITGPGIGKAKPLPCGRASNFKMTMERKIVARVSGNDKHWELMRKLGRTV